MLRIAGEPMALRNQINPLRFNPRTLNRRVANPGSSAWADGRGVRHLINDAGRPTHNTDIEGCIDKFRDERLNEQRFQTLH
jgi:hypothetical protein